jgi:monovalent cation/proton antiporter MnhG/PhaG subunit
MTTHPWWLAVLLGFAVAIVWLSALGTLMMRDPFERLHYMAPVSTLGVMAIAAAIALDGSVSQAGSKALLAALVLSITNPALSHATARAARIRQFGHWVIQSDEKKMVAEESSSEASPPDRQKNP